MKPQTIDINGMTCGHCVMSVKRELSKIDGLVVDSVTIGSANVMMDESMATEKNIYDAVQEAGYTVASIH